MIKNNCLRTLLRVVCGALSIGFVSSSSVHAQLFTWDDGTVENAGGTRGGDLLALNHFNTGATPVLIDEIRVLWHPISSSVIPTVALYADPNGDGNPSDITPLLIHAISIPPNLTIINTATVQTYAIPQTQVSGSFFVGAYLSHHDASPFPRIGIDFSYRGPGQSWIIENSTAGLLSLGNPVATSTMTSPLDRFVAANHMIQAHYVPVPEPSSWVLLAVGLLCCALKLRPRR